MINSKMGATQSTTPHTYHWIWRSIPDGTTKGAPRAVAPVRRTITEVTLADCPLLRLTSQNVIDFGRRNGYLTVAQMQICIIVTSRS